MDIKQYARKILLLHILAVLLLAAACTTTGNSAVTSSLGGDESAGKVAESSDGGSLLLATTTSTYDSGLLDFLLPEFQKDTGIYVKVLSVGTGQAIKYGEDGNVDVILVHSPAAEKKFVDGGDGIERRCLMYNDFIILGPEDDPAGVRGLSPMDAFVKILSSGERFVSRGDDSGTHKKEKEIWASANTPPSGDNYLEAGLGMAEALRLSSEKKAYILSDRATFLSLKDTIALNVIVEGDSVLLNPYAVILVNPAEHSNVNEAGARAFSDWLLSERGQSLIASFQVAEKSLFEPLRGVCMG